MRRVHFLLFSWFLCCLSLFSRTSAERSTYIVHLDKSLMPKIFASHKNWHSSIIDTIKIVDPTSENHLHHESPKLLYSYDNVLHGFSAVLSKNELENLENSPGFISAYMDRTVEAHTTHTPQFLNLRHDSGLWPVSSYGQDVIIGVLDSGIWPESASFRDDGLPEIPKKWKGICKPGTDFNSSLCNRKLIGANYFNKGILASRPGIKIPMNSARDNVYGHGTHVASIAAGGVVKGASYFGYAPGTARGIAPRARIAAYKFSFEEGTYTSDLIAAMDQAVADGVNIITISYGWSNIPLHQDSIAIASFGAMMKGVLVSASAGNNGPDLGTLNNGVPWIVTVGSCNVDRRFSGTLTLGNGVKITGFSVFPVRTMIKDLPLIFSSNLSYCDEYSSDDLAQIPNAAHSIMICYSNAVEVSDQMDSISQSKFGGAIYVSDDPEVLSSNYFPNPGVVISTNEGKRVIDYATRSVKPTVSISFQETRLGVKPAPVVSDFSSRGPSQSYLRVAKPDIMAPGELVLAAWPSNVSAAVIGVNTFLNSDFRLLSGTSMATPHIAGIAAMLKGAHPEWSPSAIRSAMMTTAKFLDTTQTPINTTNNRAATALDMGAGLVDPNRAVDPGLIYDATPQDYVNLLCSMNLKIEQFKTIARSSANHNCSNPSSDINYPSFIALFNLNGNYTWKVRKFSRTVTNVGAGEAKYTAKVEAPGNSTVTVFPRTLVFEKTYQKQQYTLTIRYKGVAEDQAQGGSITWVEENGHRTVRSPIVVAPEIDTWS